MLVGRGEMGVPSMSLTLVDNSCCRHSEGFGYLNCPDYIMHVQLTLYNWRIARLGTYGSSCTIIHEAWIGCRLVPL